MKEIHKIMKRDADRLSYAYTKSTSKSKKRKIANSLLSFSVMCHEMKLFDEKFDWDCDEELINLSYNSITTFRSNVLKNKEVYLKISDSVIDDYVNTSFPLYLKDIDCYRKYHSISDKEMLDIILFFLNDFDRTIAVTFKNKVNDSNLFISTIDSDCSYGLTFENSVLKKNFMFACPENNGRASIRVAISAMHEFGHNLEMDLYHNSGIINKMYNYPFHEVSSQFMEYAFMNYLIQNNIYKEDVLLYQRMYFIELFYFILGMNLFSEMEKVNNTEYTIDSDKMEKKEKLICDRVNYYGFSSIDIDKFDNAYLYGIGYLFAPYLYDYYKSGDKDFMKYFKDALLTYPHTNSISAFEKVGVDEDILIKGNTLKKILKSSR